MIPYSAHAIAVERNPPLDLWRTFIP